MARSGERKNVGSVAGSLLIFGVIGLMIYAFGTSGHYGFGFPIGLVAGFFTGALTVRYTQLRTNLALGWLRLGTIALVVGALGIFFSDVLSGLLGPHTIPEGLVRGFLQGTGAGAGGEMLRIAMLRKRNQ